MLGLYHSCNANRLLHTGFSSQRSADLYRRQGVHSQDVCDPYLISFAAGYLSHTILDPLQHISHIGIILPCNILDLPCLGNCFHDHICTCINTHLQIFLPF